MTKQEREELRKLYEKTTQGEWSNTHIFDGEEVLTSSFQNELGTENVYLGTLKYETDSKFAALVHNQFPKLLEHIERLEAALEKCREQRKFYKQKFALYSGRFSRVYVDTFSDVMINDDLEIDEILKGDK